MTHETLSIKSPLAQAIRESEWARVSSLARAPDVEFELDELRRRWLRDAESPLR